MDKLLLIIIIGIFNIYYFFNFKKQEHFEIKKCYPNEEIYSESNIVSGYSKGQGLDPSAKKSEKYNYDKHFGNSKGSGIYGETGSKGLSHLGISKGISKGSKGSKLNYGKKSDFCETNKIVEYIEQLIKEGSESGDKELVSELEKSLEIYKKDCNLCNVYDDFECHKEAIKKIFRRLPSIKDKIYPWLNFDWDYGIYIDNKFSTKATGSSSKGKNFQKNLELMLKYIEGYLFKANPGASSDAKVKNKHSDFPIYDCKGKSKNKCEYRKDVMLSNLPNIPYSDPFFDKNLTGYNSSSYFAQIGYCDRPDITSEKECKDKKFKWVNKCYQPRYMYLNNSPGLSIGDGEDTNDLKGYLPSTMNDFLSLTPDKLLAATMGEEVPGYMEIQKCSLLETNVEKGNSKGKIEKKSEGKSKGNSKGKSEDKGSSKGNVTTEEDNSIFNKIFGDMDIMAYISKYTDPSQFGMNEKFINVDDYELKFNNIRNQNTSFLKILVYISLIFGIIYSVLKLFF